MDASLAYLEWVVALIGQGSLVSALTLSFLLVLIIFQLPPHRLKSSFVWSVNNSLLISSSCSSVSSLATLICSWDFNFISARSLVSLSCCYEGLIFWARNWLRQSFISSSSSSSSWRAAGVSLDGDQTLRHTAEPTLPGNMQQTRHSLFSWHHRSYFKWWFDWQRITDLYEV